MSVVVDASVFVASAQAREKEHQGSLRFFSCLRSQRQSLLAPSLVIPECAGAIARVTGDSAIATDLILLMEGLPQLEIIPLSTELARSAAEIAASCRLRGSDACYVAVAKDQGAALITWDLELLDRGARLVTTRTPEQWMQEQQS